MKLLFIISIFRDILMLDEDGYGVVAGRIKDIIIRGGENIQPQEIEYYLESHPSIIQAQVCAAKINLYKVFITINLILFFKGVWNTKR